MLDVTNNDQIKAVVAAAEKRFAKVDVLVNNAGYGYLGAIEEGDDAEVRALFDTNLFAPVALIKAVLPGMRERRQGYIVNISSIGGLVTYAGVGYYNMVKGRRRGLVGRARQRGRPARHWRYRRRARRVPHEFQGAGFSQGIHDRDRRLCGHRG